MKIEFPKENRGAVIQTKINQRMPQRLGEQVSNSGRIIKETVSNVNDKRGFRRNEDKEEMMEIG